MSSAKFLEEGTILDALVEDTVMPCSYSERWMSIAGKLLCTVSSEEDKTAAGTRDNEEYRQISLSCRGKLQYMIRS